MKRFFVLFLTLMLTMTLASPVFAAGPKTPKGTFSLVGEIVSLDPATQQVSVHVIRGNTLVKSYIGTDLTLNTTAATRFLLKDGTTTTLISFSDLKVGDAISVNGNLSSGVWTAKRITVGASLIHY